jgi:hypothetical protein
MLPSLDHWTVGGWRVWDDELGQGGNPGPEVSFLTVSVMPRQRLVVGWETCPWVRRSGQAEFATLLRGRRLFRHAPK